MITNFLRRSFFGIAQPVGHSWFQVAQRFSECVRTRFRIIRWNQLSENPAPEGRSRLAQRFSAGKSGRNDSSPGGTTEFSHAHCSAAIGALFYGPLHSFLITLLALTASAFLYAQDPRPLLIPITRDEVWQAVASELRQRGVREEQLLRVEEIDLPVMVPAAAARSLRVSMVCWDADLARAQFQLECREPGQCLPFLAYADAGRSTAMGSEKIAGSSCRNGSRLRAGPSATRKAIVRTGDRATVLFRGSRFNLTALVTCLERGAAGDVIRVRNQEGQIFRARISAPARLEALSQ